VEWGDTHFSYKKYLAIIVFACVDAWGKFTYVNVRGPGQVGDAYIWNGSSLHTQIMVYG